MHLILPNESCRESCFESIKSSGQSFISNLDSSSDKLLSRLDNNLLSVPFWNIALQRYLLSTLSWTRYLSHHGVKPRGLRPPHLSRCDFLHELVPHFPPNISPTNHRNFDTYGLFLSYWPPRLSRLLRQAVARMVWMACSFSVPGLRGGFDQNGEEASCYRGWRLS